ncbi:MULTISPECIES: hypothetical protein [Gordonia]|uniref:hypothetical protein n=1 Tax=Gordonia TaxID=2053 RepID=UPI001F05EBC4|nr:MULTISPECIES: hypothetical protein [Gordonia]UPG66483.1 hypothetical protein MVF96_13230 [Gordonia hongkongensis]
MQATAVGFGVDIAFFTTSFHHRHRRHPMPVRVVLASNGWHDYYRMAAALYDLPPPQRAIVLAVIDVLLDHPRR